MARPSNCFRTIPYGDDADNVCYDAQEDRVWVGYGSGALGAINQDGAKLADIKLDAHPESFQLETKGSRIFVNLPRSQKIAVVDRTAGKVIASWTTGGPQANFPMALDEADHRLFVVCRNPARMVVLDTSAGKVIATVPAVGDSDDVFYDAARKRIYATGGEGAISVFQQQDPDHYTELAKITTVKGARTGYFYPDLNRFPRRVKKFERRLNSRGLMAAPDEGKQVDTPAGVRDRPGQPKAAPPE
jgi:DNA-binding beta-propeller fold protein YncE